MKKTCHMLQYSIVAESLGDEKNKQLQSTYVALPTIGRVIPVDADSPLLCLVLLEVDLSGIQDGKIKKK